MPVRKKTTKTKAKPSIADRIESVQEMVTHQAMLVYGHSGTGKTQFASTFPKPILILDIKEKGTDTVKGIPDIDILPCNTYDDVDEIFWLLRDGELRSKDSGEPYRTIVFDQITNLQDMIMEHVRELNKMKPSQPMSIRLWGQISGIFKTFTSNFKDLTDQYNLLLIAHERTFKEGDEDEDNKLDPNVGARVMPSVNDTICGAMDAIGCTFIREEWDKDDNKTVDYCMRIGPHAYYTTKIRRPVEAGPLPDFLVDATYEKILRLQQGLSAVKPKPKRKAKAKTTTRRKTNA